MSVVSPLILHVNESAYDLSKVVSVVEDLNNPGVVRVRFIDQPNVILSFAEAPFVAAWQAALDASLPAPPGQVFQGATDTTDGTAGYVPAPFIADRFKFLCGNGAWAVPEGSVSSVGVVSTDLSVANSPIISSGNITLNINNYAVTNTKLAQVGPSTFKGRVTAGVGPVEDMSVAQAKVLLNLAGSNTGDQTITLTNDVTGSGTGSFATTISAGAVTLAKMAALSANSFIGNNTGSAATPLALSGAQATAMLDTFTPTTRGLVPVSGGGTTNYLRADGTWAAPGNISGTLAVDQVAYGSGSNAIQGTAGFTFDGSTLHLNVTGTVPLPNHPGGTVLHVASANDDGDYTILLVDTFMGTGGGHSVFMGRTARGTVAAPSAVQEGDELVCFEAVGYGATGFSGPRAELSVYAAENWTDVAQGTRIGIFTTPAGSIVKRETARFWEDGGLSIGENTSTSYGVGTLTVAGTGTPPAFPYVKFQIFDTVNGYLQAEIQNLSNGADASTDLAITADNGDDDVNWVDFGINSSGYSSVDWTLSGANDAYLYASDGALTVGTAAVGKYVSIFTGGTLLENARVTVNDTTISLTPGPATSGTEHGFQFVGALNTGLAVGQESIDAHFELARTVEWQAGAIGLQRAVLIDAPTYAFDGASTITSAATFAIEGAPVAGTNATITTTMSLWVQSGLSVFGQSTADNASIRLPHGTVTPAAPQNGDLWTQSTGLYARINGATVGPYISGNQNIALSGDVTGSGTTAITTTIGAGAVTLGKMANLAASSLIGNNTGSAATPVALSVAQVKTLLAYTAADVGAVSTLVVGQPNGVAGLDGTGKVPTAQLPAASPITVHVVANQAARLALTANTGDFCVQTDTSETYILTTQPPSVNANWAELTSAPVTSVNGYTGAVSLTYADVGAAPAFTSQAANLVWASPNGSAGVPTFRTLVAADVSGLTAWATKAYPTDASGLLRNNGSGTLSWDTTTYLTANQTITLTGNVTGSGTTSITTTIAAGAVTLARMANLAANSFIGNNTGSATTPVALSVAQAKTLLAITTADVSGLTAWATKNYPADAAGLLRNNGSGTLTWDTTSYLTANQNITLGGDLSGSGTTSITGTVMGIRGFAVLAPTTGFLRFNGSAWVYDSSTYLTANQSITVSGDATGSGTTSIPLTVTAIRNATVPALAVGALYYNGLAFVWSSLNYIGGSIAANQVAFGSGANTIQGSATLTYTATAGLALTPTAVVTGTQTALTITGAVNTGQTASTEAPDVALNLARTVTFVAGALATQRAVRILAPTYAFAGTSTITTAATLAVSGAPVAGTNATITTPLAFWAQAGHSAFSSTLSVGSTALRANAQMDVLGRLRSNDYVMGTGPDMSLLPVVGGQSVVSSWWGLQLAGNRQDTVEYTPVNIGAAGDFTVGIPSGQAGSIGLLLQGAVGQTGDLLRLQTSAAAALAGFTAGGYAYVGGATASTSTALALPLGTTGVSSLRMPHGAAPNIPVNGDFWTTATGLFMQINGATVGPINSTQLFSQTQTVTFNGTAQTSLVGTGIGSMTIPANYLTAGKRIRLVAAVSMTNAGTYTTSFVITFGTWTATLTAPTTQLNAQSSKVTCEFVVYAAGASVTIAGSAVMDCTGEAFQMQNKTAAAFNTTIANTVQITGAVTAAGASMSCHILSLESLFF